MLTHSPSIEAVPTLNSGDQGETALRLRFADFNATCTVRATTTATPSEPARLAAVLADMLRPGWVELATPLGVPIVRDGLLYRGFRMLRASRMDGAEWELVVVTPAEIGSEFDWGRLVARLDEAHSQIFNGNSDD